MAVSIKITNSDDDIFLLQDAECKLATYSMSNKIFKETLPTSSSEKAIIINLGSSTTITIPFLLRETTGDASDGTHTTTVKTVQEKVDYLLNTFIKTGLEEIYTIDITTSVANIIGITGTFENFSLDLTAEKPNNLPGSMTISVGGGSQ